MLFIEVCSSKKETDLIKEVYQRFLHSKDLVDRIMKTRTNCLRMTKEFYNKVKWNSSRYTHVSHGWRCKKTIKPEKSSFHLLLPSHTFFFQTYFHIITYKWFTTNRLTYLSINEKFTSRRNLLFHRILFRKQIVLLTKVKRRFWTELLCLSSPKDNRIFIFILREKLY